MTAPGSFRQGSLLFKDTNAAVIPGVDDVVPLSLDSVELHDCAVRECEIHSAIESVQLQLQEFSLLYEDPRPPFQILDSRVTPRGSHDELGGTQPHLELLTDQLANGSLVTIEDVELEFLRARLTWVESREHPHPEGLPLHSPEDQYCPRLDCRHGRNNGGASNIPNSEEPAPWCYRSPISTISTLCTD